MHHVLHQDNATATTCAYAAQAIQPAGKSSARELIGTPR